MGRLIDLSGKRFGRLLAIERDTSRSPKERKYRTLWKCKCDCGKEVVVWANNLVRGHTLSCGCYKIETFIDRETEHGMSDTRLYEIWKGMSRIKGILKIGVGSFNFASIIVTQRSQKS